MLLWGSEWREETNGLTPSKKSRGNDDRRTPERKDSEELNRVVKRHLWEDRPLFRCQEDHAGCPGTHWSDTEMLADER